VGAFYALRGDHLPQARLYLKHGTLAGLVASVLVAFPTGDAQAKIVARYQEPALAAMEGASNQDRWPTSRSSVSPTWPSDGSTTRFACPDS
jgi:cytochrome bd-type quinol oxidase subunit 1